MIALLSGLMKLLSTLGCAVNAVAEPEAPPPPVPPEGRPLVFIDIDSSDCQPLLTFSGVTGQTHWLVEAATDITFGSLLGSYEVSGPTFKFGSDSPSYDFSQWYTPVYIRARAVNDAGESPPGDVVGAVWGESLVRGWTSGASAGWPASATVYTQGVDYDQSVLTISTPYGSMGFAFDEYAGGESPVRIGAFPSSSNTLDSASMLYNAINMNGGTLHVEAVDLDGQTFTIRATEEGSAFALEVTPSDGVWNNSSTQAFPGGDAQGVSGYVIDMPFAPALANGSIYVKPLVFRAYKTGTDGWTPCSLELYMPDNDSSPSASWYLPSHPGDAQLWLKGESAEEGNAGDVGSTVWEGGVWQGSMRAGVTISPEQIESGMSGGSIDLYFTYRLVDHTGE